MPGILFPPHPGRRAVTEIERQDGQYEGYADRTLFGRLFGRPLAGVALAWWKHGWWLRPPVLVAIQFLLYAAAALLLWRGDSLPARVGAVGLLWAALIADAMETGLTTLKQRWTGARDFAKTALGLLATILLLLAAGELAVRATLRPEWLGWAVAGAGAQLVCQLLVALGMNFLAAEDDPLELLRFSTWENPRVTGARSALTLLLSSTLLRRADFIGWLAVCVLAGGVGYFLLIFLAVRLLLALVLAIHLSRRLLAHDRRCGRG